MSAANYLKNAPISVYGEAGDYDRALWDIAAKSWALYQKSKNDFIRQSVCKRFFSKKPCVNNKVILDIGCGSGEISKNLALHGAVVHAFDFSPKMIDLAKTRYAGNDKDVNFYVADATNLKSFPNEFCDIAICVFSMLSIRDYRAALMEAHRVCSNKGCFYISLYYPGLFKKGYIPAYSKNTIRSFTLDDSEQEVILQWNLKGMPKQIRTMTYFRPLSLYLQSARESGFAIKSVTCWDNKNFRCELKNSSEARVVDIELEKSWLPCRNQLTSASS